MLCRDPMAKVERLINLIALLMETRRPLTPEQIRAAIYKGQSDVAFKRMFERDKEELRDIGIPLERAATDVWETEEGYLIRREEATLPDLGLEPDEQAALWLAARASLGGDTTLQRALLKVSLAGGTVPSSGSSADATVAGAASPHLPGLLDAIAERRRVRFRYRTGGGGAPASRTVEPHALEYRGGWYLAAYDTNREAVRHFKLDRFASEVTPVAGKVPQFEPPASAPPGVPHGPWEGAATIEARIAFGPSSAWWVQRRTGARVVAQRDDGWIELAVPMADRTTFLSWVLGFADDAEILSPDDLRAAAIERLRRAAGVA
jgi:predicted DNA-binding transcriptional regulator YafY